MKLGSPLELDCKLEFGSLTGVDRVHRIFENKVCWGDPSQAKI